jgi:hypothetical protein
MYIQFIINDHQKRIESAITNQGKVKEYVLSVEVQQRESIMGFSGGRTRDFLRITVASPKHVPTARGIELILLFSQCKLSWKVVLPFHRMVTAHIKHTNQTFLLFSDL